MRGRRIPAVADSDGGVGREGDLLATIRVVEAGRWLSERRADIPQGVVELVDRSRAVVLEQQRTQGDAQ